MIHNCVICHEFGKHETPVPRITRDGELESEWRWLHRNTCDYQCSQVLRWVKRNASKVVKDKKAALENEAKAVVQQWLVRPV